MSFVNAVAGLYGSINEIEEEIKNDESNGIQGRGKGTYSGA